MPCVLLPLLPFFLIWLTHNLTFSGDGAAPALARWAKAERLRIVREERRLMWWGPFWLGTSGYQVIYRISVEDEAGRQRTGWVRVGNTWGTNWDRIKVRWDSPPSFESDPSRPAPGPSPMWDRDLDA